MTAPSDSLTWQLTGAFERFAVSPETVKSKAHPLVAVYAKPCPLDRRESETDPCDVLVVPPHVVTVEPVPLQVAPMKRERLSAAASWIDCCGPASAGPFAKVAAVEHVLLPAPHEAVSFPSAKLP
jgi:hypothetical protein